MVREEPFSARECPSTGPVGERGSPVHLPSASMVRMGSHQDTATGRHDLEPFWPSRQHHDFDRVCCRATNARAL